MNDISTLRAMRGKSFDNIVEAFSNTTKGSNSNGKEDTRFWQAEKDQAGNGSAVIRFLDAANGDTLPYAKYFSHSFQGPTGKWYIENCLTTLGEKDPVVEANNALWAAKDPAKEELARKRSRNVNYIANILVVSDPKHPENNGKVFLFRFGKKIFDKLMDKAVPTEEDIALGVTPIKIFDLWEGANFRLKMRRVDKRANFDNSHFDNPSALFDGDEAKLLEVLNAQHKLSEFTDPKNFKSYEVLEKKLNDVLSETSAPAKKAENISFDDVPDFPSGDAPSPSSTQAKPAASTAPPLEEDYMAYFNSIAKEA